MQETLIRLHIMTIEDLAIVNDEGLRRIGMGAMELRAKAKNWLQSMKDHGPLVSQVTALEKENKILQSQVETLSAQVAALRGGQSLQPQIVDRGDEITAADLLDDEPSIPEAMVQIVAERLAPALTPAEQYEVKFGKKPHHRMLPESILAALKE
jgi:hypothetical protein